MTKGKKIWGIDVSKDYIIAFDGKIFYKFTLGEIEKFVNVVKGDIVVLEQTGNYSLPWILSLLKRKTVDVYIAHTTSLKELRNLYGFSKNDVVDAQVLRDLFLQNYRRFTKFEENRFWLRFYLFSYFRTVKDFTTTVNRLRSFLFLVNPSLASFKTSKKGLLELKEKIGGKVKGDFVYSYVDRYIDK